MDYTKHERIWLKDHSEFNEKWVQGLIEKDPVILGLGDLYLKDRERTQPRAGRLDLLLQDLETQRRYEVELQLGATDESHIIRTIEYWDIEKKRYPQYDHCAVIVAEDITSRFLNVISLLHGQIPMIALQMQALKVGEQIILVFTKVLDELRLGLVDEDEDTEGTPADRSYWEVHASKDIVVLTDEILAIARKVDQSLLLRYNKGNITLVDGKRSINFLSMTPRKKYLRLKFRMPQSDYVDNRIEKSGLERLFPDKRDAYRLRLTHDEVSRHREVLEELVRLALNNQVETG